MYGQVVHRRDLIAQDLCIMFFQSLAFQLEGLRQDLQMPDQPLLSKRQIVVT